MLASHADLARKLDTLEKKHDARRFYGRHLDVRRYNRHILITSTERHFSTGEAMTA